MGFKLTGLNGRRLRTLVAGAAGFVWTERIRAFRRQHSKVISIGVASPQDPRGVDRTSTWLEGAAS